MCVTIVLAGWSKRGTRATLKYVKKGTSTNVNDDPFQLEDKEGTHLECVHGRKYVEYALPISQRWQIFTQTEAGLETLDSACSLNGVAEHFLNRPDACNS